jgi:hypothetical protein
MSRDCAKVQEVHGGYFIVFSHRIQYLPLGIFDTLAFSRHRRLCQNAKVSRGTFPIATRQI